MLFIQRTQHVSVTSSTSQQVHACVRSYSVDVGSLRSDQLAELVLGHVDRPHIAGNAACCLQVCIAVKSRYNNCIVYQREMSLHQIVLIQRCHCSQSAVLGSPLHGPYIENVLITSVLILRDYLITTVTSVPNLAVGHCTSHTSYCDAQQKPAWQDRTCATRSQHSCQNMLCL